LGATIIGWFGALIWACSAVHISLTGNHGGESGLNLFVNDPKLVRVLHADENNPQNQIEQISNELIRLKVLRDSNILKAEEFNELKRRLIGNI